MPNSFAALPQTAVARPAPSVVITLGDFAARVARQVREIYLRGDARRAAGTNFYQLVPDNSSGMAFVDLDGPVESEASSSPANTNLPFLQGRQAALKNALQHPSILKDGLERILHEQRVHERLIQLGWTEIYSVPLNFFILLDAGDPWAAGAYLPLGAVINEVLANTDLAQAHWLISTGVFPDSPADHDLAVWSTLEAFDDFLRPQSDHRNRLVKALNGKNNQPPDFAVYLFDSYKHGAAKVRDAAGLGTLMGNALLALLQDDLALRYFQQRNDDAMFERGSYYSSIGASALVFDPDALQVACAHRIGQTFLAEKILSAPSEGQISVDFAKKFMEGLDGIAVWLEDLCAELPPEVSRARIHPDSHEITASPSGLKLPLLDYLQVRQTPWVGQIQEDCSGFSDTIMPKIEARLDHNSEKLRARLNETMQVSIDCLPLEASLYPGGLQNALHVLNTTVDWIEQTARSLEKLAEQTLDRQSLLAEKLAAQLEEMQEHLSAVPALPWLLKILPLSLRDWLVPLYMLRKYGRHILPAQNLRDECLELVPQLCGAQLETAALERLQTIVSELQDQLAAAQTDLAELEKKFIQAAQAFLEDWGEFPLAAEENGWDPVFRQPLLNREVAEWAYNKWYPDIDAWVPALCEARPLFSDWRSVTPEALEAWVLEKATRAYRPVWSIDLETLFDLQKNGDIQAPTPSTTEAGFGKDKASISISLTMYMSAAVPPIRPDFDAVGGSTGSSMVYQALIGSPEWKHCRLPPPVSGAVNWQEVFTGDSYTALLLKSLRCVPLAALVGSYGQARARLSALPSERSTTYDLLASINPHSSSILETIDPNNPDTVRKSFQWKFRPRGSGKEFEQKIELSISRSRFEYYRRKPRLVEMWNCYAEEEMPEVRDLASEFQKLHAVHRWSTYNQAYNILCFVQSCFPYSRDPDTTGHKDWPRYPIETLMEGTGDCEDVAILCAAVIARLGLQVVLLFYIEESGAAHVAFGVAGADNLKGDYVLDRETGRRYFYGEATAKGFRLGELPGRYVGLLPEEILPVNILMQDGSEEESGSEDS